MRWVLDGYNVIRRDPRLQAREAESLEAGRSALLGLVARIAGESADVFTVVFDGARRAAGAPGAGRVEVVFSRPPETADDVVRRLAARLRDGAVAVTAEAFLRAATAPSGPPEDMMKDETEDEDEPSLRRGPRWRPSREARAADRVLRRLRAR